MNKELVLGTRGSRLALIQAGQVASMITSASGNVNVRIKVVKTEGDIDLSTPLAELDGRGAFVGALENSLLDGDIDIAVHSLKDLPSQMTEGLVIGAVPVRENPRDAFIAPKGITFENLPPGSKIATGSPRRTAQLSALRPDCLFPGIRGNVETRIEKVEKGYYDAVILAAAGLNRLGLSSRISAIFDTEEVVPAPCQGALGVQCRSDDDFTLSILKKIDDPELHLCADAERLFISVLGMGCHTPVAALAVTWNDMFSFMGYASFGKTVVKEEIKTTKDELLEEAKKIAIKFLDIEKKAGKEDI